MRTNQEFTLLQEMATFVQVVECGSFSQTARKLGATPSAVSRSIARLEKALNTRLLQRTTRKLRLSDSGQAVFQHAQAMMHAMQGALEAAGNSSSAPEGRLRIAAPRALGRFLIHPLVLDFLQQHPDIQVVFQMEDRYIDLIDEHIDLAFRITDEPPPGMMGRQLMRIEHVVCASPSYLEMHGMPAHPHALKSHSCITLDEEPVNARWHFSRAGKQAHVDIAGRYSANHSGVRLDAVRQHLGIGSLPAFVAQAALAAGEVVQVLADWEFKTNFHGNVWMLYPQTRHLPARMQVFIDFMVQHLAPRVLAGPVKATAQPQ